MNTRKTTNPWTYVRRYRKRLAFAVAVPLVVFAVVAFYFSSNDQYADNTRIAWLTVAGILTNLASTVIVFWVASLLFSHEDEQQLQSLVRSAVDEALSKPENLRQVRWAELIANASEIDFVVQAWNGWAEQPDIAQALKQFFERGGHFRLYVYDPTSTAASKARAQLEARTGKSPHLVVAEIQGTYNSIDDARTALAAGASNSKFEVHHVDHVNWYFAVLFKGRDLPGTVRARDVLVLSIYSHTPRRSPWLMPAIVIYPDMHENLLEWFDGELIHLRTPSATPRTRASKAKVN